MDDEIFELVELSSGSIALKRHGEHETLISVNIGQDIENQLGLDRLEFVRVMLQAGFSEAADRHEEQAVENQTVTHTTVIH